MDKKNIKTKYNSILFASIISSTFILIKVPTNAMVNSRKLLVPVTRVFRSLNSRRQIPTNPYANTNPYTTPTPTSTIQSNQNSTTSSPTRNLPPIRTAPSEYIFAIYTKGSSKSRNTSNATKTETSKKERSTHDSFKLNPNIGRDPSLPPLIYSRKGKEYVESKITKYTIQTIKMNLPNDTKETTQIKFDKESGKLLSMAINHFVYKSAMKTINES